MANNEVTPGDDCSKDDDFVILETFGDVNDSAISTASTISEKQTYESLEKVSDSSNSLGDSTINEKPYYESSRFIDLQLALEKKRSLLGDVDGGEKSDESISEKSSPAFDSGIGDEKGKGDKTVHEVGSVENCRVKGTEVDRSQDDINGSWMHVESMAYDGKGVGGGNVEGDESKLVASMKVDNGQMNKNEEVDEVKDEDGVAEAEMMLVGGINQEERGINTEILEDKEKEDEGGLNLGLEDVDESKTDGKDEKVHVADQEESLESIPAQLEDDEEDGEVESLVSDKELTDVGKEMKQEESKANQDESVEDAGHEVDSLKPKMNEEKQEVVRETPCDEHSTASGEMNETRHIEEISLDGQTGETDLSTDFQSGLYQNEPETNRHETAESESEDEAGFDYLQQAQQVPRIVHENQHLNQPYRQRAPLPNQAEENLAMFYRQAQPVGRREPGYEGNNQLDLQDPLMFPNQVEQNPYMVRRQVEQGDHHNNEYVQLDERPHQRNEPIVYNNRASCCSLLVFLPAFLVLLCAILYSYTTKPLPYKPIIAINTKTHVSPSAKTWQLVARCTAYNSSYTIQQCQWKQIHPLPLSPGNTIFPGETKECSPTISSYEIDATLSGLQVPTDLGTYTFELACGHDNGKPATKRVDIWVNELIPPIISVASYKVTLSTSIGSTKLDVSCRAVQGKVVERKWEYIDGPLVLIMPSDDGVVQLSKPGIYKFKYRCTDSFGGTALSSVITVTAKPPYVLGIDLGTSTTCIAIIKEDGSRQDIGIYDDDSDTDPCMPSVVAFGLNGDLLIGEKALHQAVVNPLSTIYEAKRLMGRSYYDDAGHEFAYRVRPTLKSHSLKGVRAAIEIPCGKSRKKLVQPELISALILRHVAEYAQKYLQVAVKDVVISVPAQFDDAQRKATMDAGLIAGLNPIKIVNEPTVAAFAANSLTEKLLAASGQEDSAEVEKDWRTVWAVVADIGGGTTDYALMQIQGSYYKVITTDGDKTLGGRDIDIRLATVMTELLQDKYPGLDLATSMFKQKLRIECENAKIVLSEKEQYSLTVEYVDEDENSEKLPLEYLLTRDEFEKHVSSILEAMVKPLDSLLARSGGLSRANVEDLYLVGGTSHILKLKELLLSYFNNVKNIRHKDPVQLVSRGAAAFGAALTGLVQVAKMPRIDAVPLPISIAVDMDDMHVIFERNRLYPCIEKRVLTTYTNNQNAIVIKVYEGEGRTADECHFLGEFELSGIPPLPKNFPEIQTTFKIDTNGILSVKASYGNMVKGMKLDVYSKSGGMIDKTREKMTLVSHKLTRPGSKDEMKCTLLEDATPMSVIPLKPKNSNVLKLSVDSQYDSVKMADKSDPSAMVPAIGMVAVKGLVTDYDSATKAADLDIVLVVDLSGSMTGVPIETMQKVILHLIDLLKENHRLGIVTYATNVHRDFELDSCTKQNKQRARNIVNNFRTLRSTNLYGGLLAGLQMAYHGGRRSRVLLFTDGQANDGMWTKNDDIIREIVRETTALASVTQAQVMLSTFGYLGEHDEFLLQQLATNVGGGTYNFLNENTALGSAFGHVLGDAIHTVAERIHLSITPLDNVRIVEAITNFTATEGAEKLTFEIPSTADQQSRHILLRLAVPPTKEEAIHAQLYRVELTYTNTLTEREEGSEEYLFVERNDRLDMETESREVDEQLNRVFVARHIEQSLEALKSNSREEPVKLLKEAHRHIQRSVSKDHTLSVCLCEDLESLIAEVENGELNAAKKSMQDSLTSHWQEKGGRSSCYVTRKEDKLISIFNS